ncbi:P-loop containing nucleoside triphosphate hydrolase protein, partial [Daedaleopsis nitida]
LPSVEEIRRKGQDVFGRRPCLWQCRATLALLRGGKDVICISGTGSGKTLTFWLPLLFRPEGIQVVITPLNVLGNQNQTQLAKVGISAVAVNSKTASAKLFQDIEHLVHRVIVVNPELAFKPGGPFQKLWRNRSWTSKIISVIWDEAHCVKTWASFRNAYASSNQLRNIVFIPYFIPSATLPDPLLESVMVTLQVQKAKTEVIRRSNDRPNIYLMVRKIEHSLTSYADLDFLIPSDWQPGVLIPKFLVFFDNIEDSLQATDRLRRRLPAGYRDKILWYNADVSAELREQITEEFRDGQILGLLCTDAFGMGVDIPDVALVVQWRLSCDMNTLWQRLGRGGREHGTKAVGLVLVDSKHFEEEQEAAEQRAQKRKATEAERATAKEQTKRRRTDNGAAGGDAGGVGSRRHRASILQPRAAVQPTAVPSTNGQDASPLSKYERLRVEYRLAQPRDRGKVELQKKTSAAAGSNSDMLAPELVNLVNAHRRAFHCYRVPIVAYYDTDQLEHDQHECTPSGPPCTRCLIVPSTICCSLCSPDHPVFAFVLNFKPATRQTAARASQVSSKYTMTSVDAKFRYALNDFRRDRTEQEYGRSILFNLGPGLVMSDDVLDRIAHCAHANKLGTLDALLRETKWDRVRVLGHEVLALVESYYPPPLPPPQNPEISSRPTRSVTCGRCGAAGHMRTSQ